MWIILPPSPSFINEPFPQNSRLGGSFCGVWTSHSLICDTSCLAQVHWTKLSVQLLPDGRRSHGHLGSQRFTLRVQDTKLRVPNTVARLPSATCHRPPPESLVDLVSFLVAFIQTKTLTHTLSSYENQFSDPVSRNILQNSAVVCV